MGRFRPRFRWLAIGAAFGVVVVGAVWRIRPVGGSEERSALRAIQEGRVDEADRILSAWLSAAPRSIPAHLLNGRLAVAKGRLAQAADELKQAQALGAGMDDLKFLRALIAAKVGRPAEAVSDLTRAFAEATWPDRQLDEALARACLETYDLKRAAAVLNRWSADFPDDPTPHLWLAEIHAREADGASLVLGDYREALHRDPNLARARLGLAESLRAAHRNAEAAEAYDSYFKIKPDDPQAHLGAGRNLAERGDDEAAERHLLRAVELNGRDAGARAELAGLLGRRGDWPAALDQLDRAIALDPYEVGIRHQRGLALARLGRPEEARAEQLLVHRLRDEHRQLAELRKRLVASPHDREGQIGISRWMFAHGHDDEGARWAERILAERPTDPDASRLLADYHDRRGEAGLANRYRLHAGQTSSNVHDDRESRAQPEQN